MASPRVTKEFSARQSRAEAAQSCVETECELSTPEQSSASSQLIAVISQLLWLPPGSKHLEDSVPVSSLFSRERKYASSTFQDQDVRGKINDSARNSIHRLLAFTKASATRNIPSIARTTLSVANLASLYILQGEKQISWFIGISVSNSLDVFSGT